MKYTPEKIESLAPGEVFVFGSNLAGIHGAGAAARAFSKFGAVWGQGVGLMRQSYALPTKDEQIKTLPLLSISNYVNEFLSFARSRDLILFYVTPIGCGLAGYSPKDIAPMFLKCPRPLPSNVVLPESFWATRG